MAETSPAWRNWLATCALRHPRSANDGGAGKQGDDHVELFGPVKSPRYLIRRDDGRMPSLALRAVWVPLRALLRRPGGERPVYYPVPGVLGVNRERATVFADEWRRWVGGGGLVLARSSEGRTVLTTARANRRREADSVLTQRWR